MSRTGKSKRTESRLLASRDWGGGRKWKVTANEDGVFLGDGEIVPVSK